MKKTKSYFKGNPSDAILTKTGNKYYKALEKHSSHEKALSEMGSGKYKHPHGTSMIGGANPKEIKAFEKKLDTKHGKGNWSRI